MLVGVWVWFGWFGVWYLFGLCLHLLFICVYLCFSLFCLWVWVYGWVVVLGCLEVGGFVSCLGLVVLLVWWFGCYFSLGWWLLHCAVGCLFVVCVSGLISLWVVSGLVALVV